MKPSYPRTSATRRSRQCSGRSPGVKNHCFDGPVAGLFPPNDAPSVSTCSPVIFDGTRRAVPEIGLFTAIAAIRLN